MSSIASSSSISSSTSAGILPAYVSPSQLLQRRQRVNYVIDKLDYGLFLDFRRHPNRETQSVPAIYSGRTPVQFPQPNSAR